jgi:GAF domain-containing protein
MPDDDLWERFADLARGMSESAGLADTLRVAVDGTQALVVGADSVGISMVHHRRRIETPAATDAACRRGDELQYELGEGPCLQSIHQQETVKSPDLRTEQRWPAWSSRVAAELGFRGMLCLQLFVTHDTIGALNLYSRTVDAFDADDEATALALAAHIAVALTAAKEFESLESVVAARTVVGQAEGMLMQRYRLTPQQAFAVLARQAQASGTRLRHVAEDIVRNGIAEQ